MGTLLSLSFWVPVIELFEYFGIILLVFEQGTYLHDLKLKQYKRCTTSTSILCAHALLGPGSCPHTVHLLLGLCLASGRCGQGMGWSQRREPSRFHNLPLLLRLCLTMVGISYILTWRQVLWGDLLGESPSHGTQITVSAPQARG